MCASARLHVTLFKRRENNNIDNVVTFCTLLSRHSSQKLAIFERCTILSYHVVLVVRIFSNTQERVLRSVFDSPDPYDTTAAAAFSLSYEP